MARKKLRADWLNYASPTFDELMKGPGKPHTYTRPVVEFFSAMSEEDTEQYKTAADLAIKEMGITFTVYNDEEGSIDRAWPFDIVPRIIAQSEWAGIEKGLKQRVKALNLFIDDLYGEQKIVKDKVFPKELLEKSKNFRKECIGIKPPHQVWAHICGSDLVRDADGIEAKGPVTFCHGLSPNAGYPQGPGAINVPVALGDVVINPGDLMVGDRDGIVVVARARIDEVSQALERVERAEADLERRIEAGEVQRLWDPARVKHRIR